MEVIDSNRKYIDFHKLFECPVKVMPAAIISLADSMISSGNLQTPTDVVFHVGTNDLDTPDPAEVARNMIALADKVKSKFRCQIYISELPRNSNNLTGRSKNTDTQTAN